MGDRLKCGIGYSFLYHRNVIVQQGHSHPRGVINMNQNVGYLDRGIRIIIGLAFISQAFVGLHTPWGWIGIVPLATGLVGWCGLYSLLGIRTCPVNRQN